jgi:excisionase family DNA binding protein
VDDVLTTKGVAALLTLAEKTAYAVARAGEMPSFNLRGEWRIKRAELEHVVVLK